MNRLAVLIGLWLAIGLELALRQTLGLADESGGIGAPSPVFALIACIAAFAPPVPALWTGFIGGLLIDLTWGVPLWSGGPEGTAVMGQATLLGPHTLGYTAGAWVVLSARRVFVRRNPLAVALLGVIGAASAQFVTLLILLLRDALDPSILLPAQGLTRMIGALYTILPTLAMAACIRWLLPLLGLPDPYDQRPTYGRTTA